MIRRNQNTPLPEAPRVRSGDPIRSFVEGEDFTARCPDWCERVADGAWPTERGWYLAVSLISPEPERAPECEVIWLEFQTWAEQKRGDGWLVNEIGSDSVATRRDFYWIGKIKMPVIVP